MWVWQRNQLVDSLGGVSTDFNGSAHFGGTVAYKLEEDLGMGRVRTSTEAVSTVPPPHCVAVTFESRLWKWSGMEGGGRKPFGLCFPGSHSAG